MSLSSSGAGCRVGGTIMMAVGVLLFAIIQTAAVVDPMPEHIRAGVATTCTMLVVGGMVLLALGVIRGWFVRALIYVHRPERDDEDERAENVPVKRRWRVGRSRLKPSTEQQQAYARGYISGVRRRLNGGETGGDVLPFEKP